MARRIHHEWRARNESLPHAPGQKLTAISTEISAETFLGYKQTTTEPLSIELV
jgi:hypothetical protein